jgi:hypothetical protein
MAGGLLVFPTHAALLASYPLPLRLEQIAAHAHAHHHRAKTSSATIEGTVERVVGGVIQVAVDKGQKEWVVGTDAHTKIQVSGTAEPDFLHPGLVVRFQADYDGHMVKDKVGALTIITLKPTTALGVFAPGTGAKPAASGKSEIVNRLIACHGSRLSVHGTSKPIAFDLAENPKITVATSDLTWVSAGDKIVVHGKTLPGKAGACEATDLKITLAQPLCGKKKPTLSPSQATSTKSSSEKGAVVNVPAPKADP